MSLSPTGIGLIAAALSSAIVAGPAAWFARGVVFDAFERPAIIREATSKADDAAAIRILDAANRAEAAERQRQDQANAEAMRLYREAVANGARQVDAANIKLEEGIASYEAQLAAQGRSCRLNDDDLRFLHNDQPASPGSGR